MYKIKDFLTDDFMTMDLFWKTIEDIPDDHAWGKHKKNIKALFKKDGTPKAKALIPKTQKDYQTLHSTSVFIRKMLKQKMQMDRRKTRRQMMLDNIKDVKAGKDVPRRISKDLKIEEPRKNKGKPDKGKKIVKEEQIDPKALRNQLAAEYNHLVRKGDPATKELRERIHGQIKELENS